MRDLELWQLYTREDIHGLFVPNKPFTPRAGPWGNAGIARIPETERSYVFLVTFGTHQSGHDFVESITDEGVLSWQSQPQQRLSSPMIQTFIDHDDRTDTIHLFLRTAAGQPYRYFGELGYLEHDEEREQPVYFKWQLLDWPAPTDALVGLDPDGPTRPALSATQASVTDTPVSPLVAVAPPERRPTGGTSTRSFQARTLALHPDQDARNKELGLAGEHLVFDYERARLRSAGKPDLAEQVVHVSLAQGDGAGYDILSFEEDGTHRHLEVKTTRNGAGTGFFVSPNEVAFSEEHPDTFVLVRVFGYEVDTGTAKFYERPGPLPKVFGLTPSQYRATV
jgi:hypothetical protein